MEAEADRLYRAGVTHHLAERNAEAADAYERAIALVPTHGAVHNNRGALHLKLSESATQQKERDAHRATAESSLRAATRHAPDGLDAYVNLGVLYRGDGRLTEAIAAHAAAAKIAPGYSGVHEKLGNAHMLASEAAKDSASGLRHARNSASAFGAAIKLAPRDGVLFERHGEALLAVATRAAEIPERSRGDNVDSADAARAAFSEAMERLTTAVRLQPSSSGAYAKLAIAAHGHGARNSPKALEHMLLAMHHLQLAAPSVSRVVELRTTSLVQPPGCAAEVLANEEDAGSGACEARDEESWQLQRREVVYDGEELPGTPSASGDAQSACGVRAVVLRVEDAAGTADDTKGGDLKGGGEDGGGELGGAAPGHGQLFAAFATPLFVYRLPRSSARALNRQLLPELLALERRESSVRHSNRGGWQSSSGLLSGDNLHPALHTLRARTLDAVAAFASRLDAATAARGSESSPSAPLPPLRPALRFSVLNAWANINREGHDNLFHDHPQAILSGVYFVDGGSGSGKHRRRKGVRGDGGNSSIASHGRIELVDPRYSLRMHRPPEQFEPTCEALGSDSRSLRSGYLFEYSPPLQFDPSPGVFLLFPAWLMHRVRPHAQRTTRVSVSFNVWLADEGGGLDTTRRLFDAAFAAADVPSDILGRE